ncbi:hypothetical protein MTP99_003465 [Tenebrio molitor]|nr:hypothetical protein MTP99_003465 [Tenebrio molitor]
MQAARICVRARNLAKIAQRSLYFASSSVLRPVLGQNSRNHVSAIYRLGFSTAPTQESQDSIVDIATFEKVCEETLESLTEYFEEIVEEAYNLKSGDVSYSDGVLTVNLGPEHGTYVINRQLPNRQIWLSSPVSGPKRYDFIAQDKCWVYKHDGQSLHALLQKEISKIVDLEVNFGSCSHSKVQIK